MGPLKNNGKVYTEGKDKARILNSESASVFSTDKGDIPLIHTEGIIKLLNQLNHNKASGPDNISARLRKRNIIRNNSSSCSYISSIIMSTVYTR